jgi:hypothetical protein
MKTPLIARPGIRAGLSALAFLFFLTMAPLTQAESGAYRVEVLIFRYTNSSQQPREVDDLRRFAEAWPLFETRAVIYPEDPAPLGVTSDRMRTIWRRLDNSADFEPLYLQTWEQSRIDYQPPIRIHDDEVLLQRVELPRKWVEIDLTEPDMFAPYRASYYRLDGTAQLRRSRFLHLEFDLEYRVDLLPPETEQPTPGALIPEPGEPVEMLRNSTAAPLQPGTFDQQNRSLALTPANPATALDVPFWTPIEPRTLPAVDEDPPLPRAEVHRLRESRQIKTGELMYFDTPYLGVIARVSATAGE